MNKLADVNKQETIAMRVWCVYMYVQRRQHICKIRIQATLLWGRMVASPAQLTFIHNFLPTHTLSITRKFGRTHYVLDHTIRKMMQSDGNYLSDAISWHDIVARVLDELAWLSVDTMVLLSHAIISPILSGYFLAQSVFLGV